MIEIYKIYLERDIFYKIIRNIAIDMKDQRTNKNSA